MSEPILPDIPVTAVDDTAAQYQALVDLRNKMEELLQADLGEWNDITAKLLSAKIPTTNPPSWEIFRDGIYLYAFDDTTNEQAYISFHIQHDYLIGSDIYPHIHWSPGNNTNTGVVRWGFEFTIAKAHTQEAFPVSRTIYLEQASNGIAYMHNTADIQIADAIDGVNVEPDCVLIVRVFRDASHTNDTFVGDAFGIEVDLHYQRDRDGTKNREPNFYD